MPSLYKKKYSHSNSHLICGNRKYLWTVSDSIAEGSATGSVFAEAVTMVIWTIFITVSYLNEIAMTTNHDLDRQTETRGKFSVLKFLCATGQCCNVYYDGIAPPKKKIIKE